VIVARREAVIPLPRKRHQHAGTGSIDESRSSSTRTAYGVKS
jgi:hypothetical protein